MHGEFEESANVKQTGQELGVNPSFSSPTSAVSSEETRILTEHIHQQNMFKLISLYEPHRKTLTLKKFFKMKRNQQVVISPVNETDGGGTIEGKVAAIGRDFVMLTNLQKRLWIPYKAINSATIPFGFPTYSNTHQHHIYDNGLQHKLVTQFGETVAKRDALVQQFFEESFRTSLHSWKGTAVEVKTAEKSFSGRITKTTEEKLWLKLWKTEIAVSLHDIELVSTIHLFSLWKQLLQSIFKLNDQ